MIIIGRKFKFESAHHLPAHPGACRNLHGHTYHGEVQICGEVDPETGMLIDYSELKRLVDENVVAAFDHVCINDFMENPTAELMVQSIFSILTQRVYEEFGEKISLYSVSISETENSTAIKFNQEVIYHGREN